MSDGKRVPYLELREFVGQVMLAVNAAHAQADVFADALLWSDLIGRPTHGVWRLPAYVKRIELGLIKCPCSPRRERGGPGVERMDGDEGLGHYVGHAAMHDAITLANEQGIGAVAVHNSNHFGTGAYYVQLAAQQNMLGLAMSNSLAKVAPHGGVRAVFGTNPFAFAAPRPNGESLLFDMATTAICGSQVMKHAEKGEALPEGIAIDAEGQPIRDPARVSEGALLPFGGAKGFGLTLMIEILCSVLSGAMYSTGVNSMFNNFNESGRNGHFFLAIDIARFMSLPMFTARLEALLDQVRGSARQPGEVVIPGEMRWRRYRDNLVHGVALDAATVKALSILALDHGVPSLFPAAARMATPRSRPWPAGVGLQPR